MKGKIGQSQSFQISGPLEATKEGRSTLARLASMPVQSSRPKWDRQAKAVPLAVLEKDQAASGEESAPQTPVDGPAEYVGLGCGALLSLAQGWWQVALRVSDAGLS